MNDIRRETIKLDKEGLKIIITYGDKNISYIMEDFKASGQDNKYTDQPVAEITIISHNGEEINLSQYWNSETTLVGPVDDVYYSEEQKIVFFGELDKEGGLLALLHEIGHASVNERYKTEGMIEVSEFVESEIKKERHAWGWALGVYNTLRQEKDVNLEPNMDKKAIKEYVKRSLLSQEIIIRRGEIMYDAKPAEKYPSRFWKSVNPEFINRFIDELYEGKADEDGTKDEIKRSFLYRANR